MPIERYLSKEDIEKRIKSLAEEINKDFKGKEIVIIIILRGAFIFAADLVRHLNVPVQIDFLEVSSYGNSLSTSGIIKVKRDVAINIQGKDVLVIEDIVDTGLTIKTIKELLEIKEPNSVKFATLLNKMERRTVEVDVDYIGFDIPDYFVIGYGLDYAQKYRELPYIAIYKPEKEDN
jgi:hypoxanthine phosphoribosyltransferase